jgi:hypothetical protein
MLTRGIKIHDNLSVLWHSKEVFIGTRGAVCPWQRHLDPRVPGLSPKFSHEGRLQPVITVYFITDTAQPTHAHAGPSFLGRTVHGPLPVPRKWEVLWSSTGPSSCLTGAKGAEQASVWSAPLVCPAGPVDTVFVRAARGRSRRAKGGVFAFTPTFALRGTNSTKSAGAEDHSEMVKTLPSLEVVPRGVLICDHWRMCYCWTVGFPRRHVAPIKSRPRPRQLPDCICAAETLAFYSWWEDGGLHLRCGRPSAHVARGRIPSARHTNRPFWQIWRRGGPPLPRGFRRSWSRSLPSRTVSCPMPRSLSARGLRMPRYLASF